MARSCGIRLGAKHFEIVVLDGSVKRPKVTLQLEGEIPPSADPVAGAVRALREVAKKYKLPKENVGLAIDGGLAAYRTITLPFDDKSKTEQVIKFEVEGDLPQWEVDDVVVDFHTINSTGVESQLLVTAVPKEDLREHISILEQAGIEPLEAELEGTALVNAAHSAGLLSVDSAQLLVHVGDRSTSVVVVDGGKVRSMRAIQIGALSRPAKADEEEGEAAETSEVPEEDQELLVIEDDESAEAEGELPELPPLSEADAEWLDGARQRLRREIGRTLAGLQTAHEIEAVYICGEEIPGLVGSSVIDVPIERLELYPSPEEAEGGEGLPVLAFGVALRQMGGGLMRPSLRREELRYTGKLERLELPLAVLSLLIVTFLGMKLIVAHKMVSFNEAGILRQWLVYSNAYMLERNFPEAPESIRKYAKDAEDGRDTERTRYEQLDQVRLRLRREIDALKKQLGQDADITKPQSALEAGTHVVGVLKGLGERVGRFAIRKISSTYQPGTARREDRVEVKMDLTFFGSDDVEGTANYLAFKNELGRQGWCVEVVDKPTDVLENGQGIFVDSFTCYVDTTKIASPE